MRLKRIELTGVGPLMDASFNLTEPGITLFLGPNECGKSTLCEAILGILYGYSKRSEERRSWAGCERFEGSMVIEVDGEDYLFQRDFDTNHTQIVHLKVDNQDEVIFNGDANPRGRTEEPLFYRDLLQRVLGLPTKGVLQNSTMVGQIAVEIELDEELRRQISGAGQADYKQAVEALRKQFYTLTYSPLPGERTRGREGRLQEVDAELGRLREEMCESRDISQRLAGFIEDQLEISKEISSLESQLEKYIKGQEVLQQYHGLLKARSSLTTQDDLRRKTQEQIDRVKNDISRAEEELKSDKLSIFKELSQGEIGQLRLYVYSDAESIWHEIEGLQRGEEKLQSELESDRYRAFLRAPEGTGDALCQIIESQERLAQLEHQEAQIERERAKSVGRHIWGVPIGLLLFGATLGWAIGIKVFTSLNVPLHQNTVAIIAGSLIGIVFGLVGLFIVLYIRQRSHEGETRQIEISTKLHELRRGIEDLSTKVQSVLEECKKGISIEVMIDRWKSREKLQAELENIVRKREVLESREILQIRDTSTQLGKLLDSLGGVVIQERLEVYEGLNSQLESSHSTLTELQGIFREADEKLIRARNELQETILEISALEKKYPSFETLKDDEKRRLDRQEEVKDLVSECNDHFTQKKEDLNNIEQQIAILRSKVCRDPASIQEEIEDREENLKRLNLRRHALETAVVTLKEAIEEYERDHLIRLSEKTSGYFETFTGGRYPKVDIQTGDQIHIHQADGTAFDASLLSTGATDQLYLAMRLAIADMLASELKLPFVFDDSLVNFDKNRIKAARGVIEQISEDRQVILLSHDNRHRIWGKRIIEMN